MGKLFHIDQARPKTAAPAKGKLRRRLRQFGWLLVIWLLSVAALACFAGLMRLFMRSMGMHS